MWRGVTEQQSCGRTCKLLGKESNNTETAGNAKAPELFCQFNTPFFLSFHCQFLTARLLFYLPSDLTFSKHTFCPYSLFMCFVWISEQTAIFFPIQHKLVGFYNWDLTLCSPVVTICIASLIFKNSTFCPHSVFMCFVWISEQTAIIFLYNINWLVFLTDI